MSNVQEFTPANEQVTACMTTPLSSGEHYGAPLTIGIYPGAPEVWIECEFERINIPIEHLPAFIKQLKRAANIAKELKEVKQ